MHRIRRTAIHLQLPNEQGLGEIQAKISQRFRERVLPAMASIMDALVSSEHTLVIPQLKIDLGNLSQDASDEQWLEYCEKAMREVLQQRLNAIKYHQQKDTSEILIPRIQRAWQAFLFFLESGRLPWWFQRPELVDWEKDILEVAQGNRTVLEQLRAILRQNPTICQRLAFQFSAFFTIELLALSEGGITLEQLRRANEQPTAAANTKIWQQIALQITLLWTKRGWDSSNWVSFIAHLQQGTKGDALLAQLENKIAFTAIEQPDSEYPSKPFDENITEEDQPSWFIDNAGSVLLAPFLPQLLTQTGLIENQTFIGEDAQINALMLLRYLSHGPVTAAEHELTLCKLLVGLPLDWPLPQIESLSQTLQNAADELLRQVILNWTALGHCSIGGLQETFLQRPGRLSRRQDGHWLLQPERKTVDILLDRLPWGYGIVRLPWMSEMVWVEW